MRPTHQTTPHRKSDPVEDPTAETDPQAAADRKADKASRIPRERRKPVENELRRLRDDLCLTLLDVAKATGARVTNVSRWETGRAEPSLKVRWRYAKLLGITMGDVGRIIYES